MHCRWTKKKKNRKFGWKIWICSEKGRKHGCGENTGQQYFLLFPQCFPIRFLHTVIKSCYCLAEGLTQNMTGDGFLSQQKLLKDERLQSTMETENENKWLPIQVLKSVYSTPNLPEDIQVDVMKVCQFLQADIAQ